MMEWIFTFGYGHAHPLTGASLAHCYVRIAGTDADDARRKMVAAFGRRWAFQYESEEDAGVAKWQLHEIPMPGDGDEANAH